MNPSYSESTSQRKAAGRKPDASAVISDDTIDSKNESYYADIVPDGGAQAWLTVLGWCVVLRIFSEAVSQRSQSFLIQICGLG